MSIASRTNARSTNIAGITRGYNEAGMIEPHPSLVADTDSIDYLGISDLSVEVHFNDGSSLRITNPNFSTGLKIDSYEKAK